jgi:predicted signal transduction protein with EAL and GGDEF domain
MLISLPAALAEQRRYSTRIFTLSAFTALFPYLLIINTLSTGVSPPLSAVLAVTVGTAAAMVGVLHLLRPLQKLSGTLASFEKEKAPADLIDFAKGDETRLLTAAAAAAETLAQLKDTHAAPVERTGLPARHAFIAAVDREKPEATTSVLMGVLRFADYDRLAAFEPSEADRALCAFAARLKSAADQRHLLAQIDRDTFAFWFGAVNVDEGIAQLHALSYVLSQELTQDDWTLRPRLELGGAIYPLDGGDAQNLLARAQASLNDARGKDGAFFLSEQTRTLKRRRFALEQDIAGAAVRQELMLHFQPIVDIAAGKLAGAEALVRWKHPELGVISPTDFVPILEDTGLIDEIGLWVLNTACREARRWRDDGREGLKVAVNLSARQLRNPALKSIILRTLERHQLAPSDIELELTETATMADATRTLALFRELHELGIGLAIDDFGSGYSSLSYLKNLPFTKLKVDREFVTLIDQRPDSQAICRSLVELSRGLSIRLLAEGVERRQEVETLRGLGCTMFQGFYFGKPMTADDFLATVNDPAWQALLASPVHREISDLQKRIT